MQIDKVLKALADEDSISLFEAIASSPANEKGNFDYITHLNLSRKQYYSRIRDLTTAGLITKMKGVQNHRLTIFGETVCHFLDIIKIIASEDTFLKLKAMDAILFEKKGITTGNENIVQLINVLIDNHKTKDILLKMFEKKSNGQDKGNRKDDNRNKEDGKHKENRNKTILSIL